MCFLTSYANCFSTKPSNLVHVRATILYHDNDDEADEETKERKKCVGNKKKDDQDQDDEQDALLKQTRSVQKWT